MHAINNILKRSRFNNILSFLTYATGDNETVIESYESAIDESYKIFFTGIENLYTDANRDDKILFDIISKFARTHDDIYFETGMLVGFQLYRDLVEKHEYLVEKDITAILEKRKSSFDTKQETSTLESFCRHRLSTALVDTLKKDKNYQKKDEDAHKIIMQIDKIDLTHKQWKTVDRALSACNARSAEYGEMAYKQGFKDVLNLIMDAVSI